MMNEGFTPDVLKQEGWRYAGKCAICGGTKKYKYNHAEYPGVEIQWIVTTNQYHIQYKNKRKYSYIKPIDLFTYLNIFIHDKLAEK